MTETKQEAQKAVADPARGLSDSTKSLVRREIVAAELEMLGKAKQALPSVALLGAAGMFGVLSLAASYRLSVRLLEKTMPPAAAALVAATGYGVAAGASGAVGMQQLHADKPLVPVETVRAALSSATGKAKAVAGTAAKTATDTAKKATSGATAAAAKATDKAKTAASSVAKQATGTTVKAAADKAKATAGTAAKKATDSAKKATDTAKSAASGTTAKTAAGTVKRAAGTTAKATQSRSRAAASAKKPASTTKKAADTTARTAKPRTSRRAATAE